MTNILIIDDQSHLGEMLSEDLCKQEHRITCVDDLGKAIDEIRSCRPDIVLLDLYLKGFERWDLLHRLKLEVPHVPVLIVTAYDNFIDDPRLAEADDYVIKEIYTDTLKKKIDELLAQKSRCEGGLHKNSNFR